MLTASAVKGKSIDNCLEPTISEMVVNQNHIGEQHEHQCTQSAVPDQEEPMEAISPAKIRPAMLTWTDIPRLVRNCVGLIASKLMLSWPINFAHSLGDKLQP